MSCLPESGWPSSQEDGGTWEEERFLRFPAQVSPELNLPAGIRGGQLKVP